MSDLRIGGAEHASAAGLDELEALSKNVDHYDPTFLNNRVEMFRLMHAQGCPVRHSEKHDAFWLVTGYPEALEAQRRSEDFSNKQKVVPRRQVPDLIPSGLNPPEHKPVKTALAKLFWPQALAGLKEGLAQTAATLFEKGLAAGGFDVVQDLMFPLMAEFTIVHMLGLDPARAREYAEPIHNMSRRDYSAAKIKEELAALDQEFRTIVVEQRYAPDSMLAKFATLDIEGRRFSADEMVKLAFNLLIGGFGTTAAFAGSVFVFLARNPHLRRQLVDDPEVIPSAIDEMLRLFAPVQTFARRVEHDTELCGVALRQGDQLLMGYGAANYDPRVFANPEQVDFKRPSNRHMAFGVGPHRCLGENVARSVLREVLLLMIQRIPNYELVEEGVIAQSFASSMFGYSNVRIRF